MSAISAGNCIVAQACTPIKNRSKTTRQEYRFKYRKSLSIYLLYHKIYVGAELQKIFEDREDLAARPGALGQEKLLEFYFCMIL